MDLRKTSINALRCICMPDEPVRQIWKRLKNLSPEDVDIIEISIKSVTENFLRTIRAHTVHPVMLASRGEKLTEKRVRMFEQAIENSWDWIDIDMQSSEKLIRELIGKLEKAHSAAKSKHPIGEITKLILSVHDPLLTTSTRMIEEWIEQARKLGKNIPTLPKVVTDIVETEDVFRIHKIALKYSKQKIGIILHGSGDQSAESRLLQATSGSAITYLCFSKELATAKGQWTIADWNRRMHRRCRPPIRQQA